MDWAMVVCTRNVEKGARGCVARPPCAQGITDKQLEKGYPCDPTSKSKLRIVAVKGLLIRLTRNFDKQRGFVNGAIAKVFEDLELKRLGA